MCQKSHLSLLFTIMDVSRLMVTFVCIFGLFCRFEEFVAEAECRVMGKFGEGECQYWCHCRYWDQCDKRNGNCGQFGCQPGYGGTACQYENLAYRQAVETNITIYGSSSDWAKLVDGDDNSYIIEYGKSGLPLVVFCREKTWADMIQVVLLKHSSTREIATSSANDIEVVYLNDNSASDNDDNQTKTTMMTTTRPLVPYLPWSNDIELTYNLPRPTRGFGVRIRALNNKTLTLSEVSIFGGRNLAVDKFAAQGEATHVIITNSTVTTTAATTPTTIPTTTTPITTTLPSTTPTTSTSATTTNTTITNNNYTTTTTRNSNINTSSSSNNRNNNENNSTINNNSSSIDNNNNSSTTTTTTTTTTIPTTTTTTTTTTPTTPTTTTPTPTATPTTNNKKFALADLAVDGKTECQNEGEYSRTASLIPGEPPRSSWWTVYLGHHVTIWRVRIYSPEPAAEPLDAFALNVTLDDRSEVTVYRNNNASAANNVTEVILPEAVPATRLTIWRPEPGKALALCEVEVFGDCAPGYFGWLCDSECHCKDRTEVCDKLWGFCPMSGCRAGYMGDNCQEECRPGTYGLNCALACNRKCADNVCDHVTGLCTTGCVAGWIGEECDEECSPGKYGVDCSLTCSTSCVAEACDHVTGKCTNGCKPGREGEKCDQDCRQGFYGPSCSSPCSDQCMDATCHPVIGHCLAGCVAGFTGQLCDQKLPEDDSEDSGRAAIGVLVTFIIIAIIVVIALAIWWKKRRYRSETLQPHNQRDEERNVENDHKQDNSEHELTTLLSGRSDDVTDSADVTKDSEDGKGQGKKEKQGGRNRTHYEDHFVVFPVSKASQPTILSTETEEQTSPKPKPRTLITHAPETTTTTTTTTTLTTPSPRPRTTKPKLATLFSRDAHMDPPEPGEKLTTVAEMTNTAASTSARDAVSKPARRTDASPKLTLHVGSLDSLDEASSDLPDMSETSSLPRSRRATGESRKDGDGDESSPSTLIPLEQLPVRVAQWLANPRHLSKERSMLPTGKQHDWDVATSPYNMDKNRYKNIFPYDHSRVLLQPLPNDPHSDFYNASYIDGYQKEREYIAAQGPLEVTVHDFLRLIWDTNCRRVVMLTNTVELGKFKCKQYWPEEAVLTSDDITMHMLGTSVLADYTLRHLSLERGSETRQVTMYHYTNWQDNCAPPSPWSLLLFRQKIHQGATAGEGPIIVHCSAGIGRTGTYLALDILLACALHEHQVDIFQCVLGLRQQRVNMVQTLAQYTFIHEALRAAVLSSLPVPAEKFTPEYLLRVKDGERPIDKEYERLQMCLGPSQTQSTDESTSPELVGLPRDIYRVNVHGVTEATWGPVYINAVFLSNFKRKYAYIQTRSPAESGAAIHFLSMVIQHGVTRVVNLDTEQEDTYHYWSESTETQRQLGPYTVSLLSMRKAQGMTIRKLRISFPAQLRMSDLITEPEAMDSQEVTQITCSTWSPSRQTPSSVSVILEMADHIQAEDDHPVVLHCRDGHTRSGLVIVAAAILEELRTEGHVAVNYVTAHMRVPRRENIVSVEQYKFLYACVASHLTSKRGNDITTANTRKNAADNLYRNTDILMGLQEAETNPTEEEHAFGNVNSLFHEDIGTK